MSRENSTKLSALALSLVLGVMAHGQAAADATIARYGKVHILEPISKLLVAVDRL